MCWVALSTHAASLCPMKISRWDGPKGDLPALNFSDILTLYGRAVRRQEKMIHYSLHNPETRVKVLHFIEETQSSENTLDLGELNSCPLCDATSLGGQGPLTGWSQFPHL